MRLLELEQRLHLTAQFQVVPAGPFEEGAALLVSFLESAVQDFVDLLPAF